MNDYASPFALFFDVGWRGVSFTFAIWFILQIVNTNHWDWFFPSESDRDR